MALYTRLCVIDGESGDPIKEEDIAEEPLDCGEARGTERWRRRVLGKGYRLRYGLHYHSVGFRTGMYVISVYHI